LDIKLLYKEKLDRLKGALPNEDYTQEKLEVAAKKIKLAFDTGNKLMAFGNGGSAAQAQHFVAEFVGLMGKPAISITTDTSNITAISNDDSFDNVFSRQILSLGKPGDVAIGISTSGKSSNVLRALDSCKKRRIFAIGLTGHSISAFDEVTDLTINVESDNTQTIQEVHQIILHTIFESLFNEIRDNKQDG
jgi:D-sedoheptulose 7-phosphate isomerase